jgi:hypothetical protein
LQVRVIAAGSGYLSQSSACAFFAVPAGGLPAGCRLRVRWPDGATTEQALPAGAGPLTVGR